MKQKNHHRGLKKKFTGVVYEMGTKQYRSEVEGGGKVRHIIGYFDDPINGMDAYDLAHPKRSFFSSSFVWFFHVLPQKLTMHKSFNGLEKILMSNFG